jgi:hypothetical protein
MIDVAIEHRLAWAGAPPSAVDYALISDVEGFHFAKPQLAYFAEVLGHLGRLPTEAVMVGNDPTEDLDPAAALGLPVFHLSPAPAEGRPGGDYHEALRWLEAIGGEEPQPANRPEALVARFEGQLAAMLSKLRRIGDEGLRRPAGEGGLAPLQIVCHLRDVDREVNLPRLRIILERDNPFLSSVNTDDWIEQRGYIDEDPQAAVRGFIATRKTVTAALSALTPDQWQRPARHSLLGPTTLVDWIAVLAEHDLRHLADVVAPRKMTQRSA